MFEKSGLFLLMLTVLQVSARYKNVEPDFIENVIKSDYAAVSSSSSRIVSGWEAQPGQHPHHAALRFVDPVGDLRQCGGSIVSKEWIITTAYCTVNRILAIVRAGGVSLTNPEYIFESTEWYINPDFDNLSPTTQQHTITLLKMQRPVVYSKLVKAIRVQSSADAFRNYDGERVYASGNGRTETELTSDVLRWVYLRAISNSECRSIYNNQVHTTTICAQFYNVTSQSTCFHDNGGPLVHVGNDGIPTLIGVTHFFPSSSIGCDVGRPTAYIRPGAYHPWFKEVTGIDFENIQEDDDNVDTTTTTIPTDSTIVTTIPTDSTSTTDSWEQGPDENTTAPPEDSEDNEEDSESNEDDMVQLMKRLEVNVKVRVALNKYNVTSVGKEIII